MLHNILPVPAVSCFGIEHDISDSSQGSPSGLVAVTMLMPETTSIPCPKCERPIRMTLQAALQARDLGVTVECHHCHEAWLYTAQPEPTFGPLASPKYRRGRPVQTREIDPGDLDVKPQNEIASDDDHCPEV